MLDQVGLAERGRRQVRKYSLGMRQRLGLAAALLKDPALLSSTSRPTASTRPGSRSVRELVRPLGAEGRTVFVSSHLLGEVEQTCDGVAIIDRGRLVAQGPVADVLAMGEPVQRLAKVPDAGAATAALAGPGSSRVPTTPRPTSSTSTSRPTRAGASTRCSHAGGST